MKTIERNDGRAHLYTRGAMVDIFIWPFIPGGNIGHPPVKMEALIDTGATHSVMPLKIAQFLALRPVSDVLLRRIDRFEDYIAYRTMISFSELETPIERPVLATHGQHGVELDQHNLFIIGRDILAYSVLRYDGQSGKFSIDIDLTYQSDNNS